MWVGNRNVVGGRSKGVKGRGGGEDTKEERGTQKAESGTRKIKREGEKRTKGRGGGKEIRIKAKRRGIVRS